MRTDTFIRALLDAAQKAGIAEAEVYYQRADSMRILVTKGEIEEYAVNTAGGLSLRGLVGGRMGSGFTEALDGDAIDMLVRAVRQSAALITDEDEQFIFAGSPSYEKVDCSGDLGTPEQRIAFALALEKAGRTLHPQVTDLGFTGMETARETVRIVNTKGLDLSHTGDLCVAFVDAVARDGDRASTYFEFESAYGLSSLDAERVARKAVDEAAFYLDAEPCASGEMPVIFRNSAMADLLGAFAGIYSADAAQKGMSLLAGKEGETIGAPCVTLVDDPLLRGGFGTRSFDAEGVACHKKNVMEQGRLVTLLHNLKTAQKAGVQTTGNAARGGYAGPVGVAPTNFFFAPGTDDLPALEAKMGNGLVITSMTGLHSGANAISGDFSLLSKGYLVENGRRGRAVEQVTVAGNFYQLLKGAVAVGSDLLFPQGAIGSPSVWIDKLAVAGK